MSKKVEGTQEFFLDGRHLFMSLLKKSWLIAIAGVLFGFIAFVHSAFFVTPLYSSSVMLYVNNKSVSISDIDVSISASDLSASQSLIDTYMAILNNRTTMEEVIEEAEVDYSYKKLMSMVSSSKIEGTELFYVTVTGTDPYEVSHIANSIAKVLPGRIEEIIDGSSMRVVDEAIVNPGKVSPNITAQTVKYFLIGALLMSAYIALFVVIDDTIRNEDYITRTYDIPVLAIIPDFDEISNKKGSYYYRSPYSSDGAAERKES